MDKKPTETFQGYFWELVRIIQIKCQGSLDKQMLCAHGIIIMLDNEHSSDKYLQIFLLNASKTKSAWNSSFSKDVRKIFTLHFLKSSLCTLNMFHLPLINTNKNVNKLTMSFPNIFDVFQICISYHKIENILDTLSKNIDI